MQHILALIPLVLVFVLTLALGSQNGQLVQFNYLIAQGEFSLAMLLGFFFAGGFLQDLDFWIGAMVLVLVGDGCRV